MQTELQAAEFCREIERYLCRKNDGHLIRVVGPSFELVSRWAQDGVPLKVAFGGIDRYFERYYRRGPRRRPVRIEFCEADVLDVFDEWRRSTGITSAAGRQSGPARRNVSLPEHLERVVMRLTNARATGTLTSAADDLIDTLSRELDVSRRSPGGVRGEARVALVARLETLDAQLGAIARLSLGADVVSTLTREADADLDGFRAQMAPDAFAQTRERAVDRLVRERLNLPTIAFL